MKVFRTQLPTPSVIMDTDHGTFQVMPHAPEGFHKILRLDDEVGFTSWGIDKLEDEDIEFLVQVAKVALQGR